MNHKRRFGRYIGGLNAEEMVNAFMVADIAYLLSKAGFLPPGSYLAWDTQVASAYFAWVDRTLATFPDMPAQYFDVVAVSSDKAFVGFADEESLNLLAADAIQGGAEPSYVYGMQGRRKPIPVGEAPAEAPPEGEVIDVEKKKETNWIPWAAGGAAVIGIGWIVMRKKKRA